VLQIAALLATLQISVQQKSLKEKGVKKKRKEN
jgi:hypothetical protein